MRIKADWSETTLGECATWHSGGTPRTSEPKYWNGDIPWISSGSLTSFYIHDSERRVTPAGVENGTRLVAEGTVIFVVRGMSLKREFRVGITKRPVTFGQDCKALIAKPMILPEFLANVLRSKTPEVLSMVEEAGHGTGTLQTDRMKSLRIPVPPLSEQRRIVTLLSAFDELISLLQQSNSTLDAIAQATFHSWFVDFDPVRAKAEGREPEGMDAETAALFPSEFVQSKPGAAPAGWRWTTLGGAAEQIFSGGTPDTRNSEYWHGDFCWFSSGETRNLLVVGTEKRISAAAVNNSSTRLALPGDILIAAAGQGHTRGQTSYCGIETYINQSVVAIRSNLAECHPIWLFYNLRRRYEEMRGISDSHSSRGSLTTKLLARLPLCLPPRTVMDAFASLVKPMVDAQILGEQRIAVLEELRDSLLPRLISGQVGVIESPEAG